MPLQLAVAVQADNKVAVVVLAESRGVGLLQHLLALLVQVEVLMLLVDIHDMEI
jgi:hypothetical protein